MASRMSFRPGLGKDFRITEDYENNEAFSTNELGDDPKIIKNRHEIPLNPDFSGSRDG